MSELTVTVGRVAGFEGYPLPYDVHDAKTAKLLHKGVIEVGKSISLPISGGGRCRVTLSLAGRPSIQKTSRATTAGRENVTFLLAGELEASSCLEVGYAAPSILLFPAGSDGSQPAEPFELSSLGPDPFLQNNPFSRESLSQGGTSFIPIGRVGYRSFWTPTSSFFQERRLKAPSVPFALRPFVQLWKLSATGAWSVDPDSVEHVTDLPNRQRSIQVPAGASYCLEVGSPGGPNYFTYLPPGPLSVEARLRGAPGRGSDQVEIELGFRPSPLARSLLEYMRAGALLDAHRISQSVVCDSVRKLEKNSVLVLAYLRLRVGVACTDDWLGKLTAIGEPSPDVRVIRGWQALRSDPPNPALSQRWMVEAALDTTPPVYSEGLRLLIDGLQLLSNLVKVKKRQRLEDALTRVRVWGGATDWGRMLTTVVGNHPAEPLPGYRAVAELLPEVFH
jgi:hypothetical protein